MHLVQTEASGIINQSASALKAAVVFGPVKCENNTDEKWYWLLRVFKQVLPNWHNTMFLSGFKNIVDIRCKNDSKHSLCLACIFDFNFQ